MENVFLIIHLIVAIALIAVVLLQRSEGGALGIGGGGGGGLVSGRSAATALTKLTWGLGVAFVATSMALTILAVRADRDATIIEAPATAGPGEVEILIPDLGDSPVVPPIGTPEPESE